MRSVKGEHEKTGVVGGSKGSRYVNFDVLF